MFSSLKEKNDLKQSSTKDRLSHLIRINDQTECGENWSANELLYQMKGKIVMADSGFVSANQENDPINERRTSSQEVGKDKLNQLINKIQSYRELYQDVKEQIQFLLSNFEYIIELATTKIIQYLSEKVSSIVVKKQHVIHKQLEKLQMFEARDEIQNKILMELTQENKKLKEQNEGLRKKNQEGKNDVQKLLVILQKKKANNDLQVTSDELFKVNSSQSGKQLKLRKLKTFEERSEFKQSKKNQRKKSFNEKVETIDHLKEKITQLKIQLNGGSKSNP